MFWKKRLAIVLHILVVVWMNLLSSCGRGNTVTTPLSWQGIMPGNTTRDEVITLLGAPDERGEEWWGEQYFGYRIPGQISNEYNHRIFFQGDVVSWIDVAVLVDEDTPYTVSLVSDEYGSTLDRVVRSVRGRDVFTNEHVYIWSDRGIALVAIPAFMLDLELSPDIMAQCQDSPDFEERHPEDTPSPIRRLQPSPSSCHIVVRKLIFNPMRFERFWEEFEYKIPVLRPFYEGYLR